MVTLEPTPVVALEPKAQLTGKILKITLAGALVDVGQPLPGVLHISQLQQEPVNKVEDVVKEGQSVQVWVRKVRKDRIELTMIRPLRYEWKELQPEMVVKGKVVRLETYGAFVDFGAERPGMIHISEMARGYVKTAGDVVKEGDEVEAKILTVDYKKRQIRLSLKALQPEILEPEKPRRDIKRGGRHGKGHAAPEREVPAEEEAPPDLTVMQLAWQSAQERAKSKGNANRTRRPKPSSSEQEEILQRTLEKRVATGV